MNSYSLSFQEMASYSVLSPEDIEIFLQEEKQKKLDKKKIDKSEELLPVVEIKEPEVPKPMKREIKDEIKPKLKVEEEPKEIDEEIKEIAMMKKPPAKKKRKRREILRKVCSMEICKPEVCCADLEGKLPMIAQIKGPV